MATPTELADLAAAHAAQAALAVKTAAALKARLDKAPKPAAPEAVKAAAEALAAGGWIQPAQLAQAEAALANPQTAVETLGNLARKAATEIAKHVGAKDRLAGGEPVGGEKAAGELRPGDAGYADSWLHGRITSYKRAGA